MPTILVVDDSPSMRQMVASTLEGAGYGIVEAVDGEDALAKAREVTISAVITDLYMPNMDGISLIRELRKLPVYSSTPILTLTTEFSANKKTEGKTVGATGWLVKPFDPQKLLATIKILVSCNS